MIIKKYFNKINNYKNILIHLKKNYINIKFKNYFLNKQLIFLKFIKILYTLIRIFLIKKKNFQKKWILLYQKK